MIKKTQANRQKFVFLDRDGVINRRIKGYVARWKDFDFLAGVTDALKSLKESGYAVIVVSNQAGVNKGILSKKALRALTDQMVKTIRKSGGEIAGVYYCPCRDEDDCFCRKPRPGLLLEAASDYEINFTQAWLVGDEDRDIMAGQEVGCRTILLQKEKMPKKDRSAVKPDHIARDLRAAVKIIRAG